MTRRGFTLVEMMVTTVILAIVLAALGSAFIAFNRFLRVAYAESELAINAHMLRHRLLYRFTSDADSCIPGLMTLPIRSVDDVAINLHGWRFSDQNFNVEEVNARLMWEDVPGKRLGKVKLDNVVESYEWLNPAGLGLAAKEPDEDDEDGGWDFFRGETCATNVDITIKMATTFRGTTPRVTQSMRIDIPAFTDTGIGQ